eukprot:GAHX01001838.1.p1 GENE.GAHX01001838.1~~GAHX01001838.1.p1  ORF type:complete len:253 (-),score=27.05 GAHX01001838.1:16-774(-)
MKHKKSTFYSLFNTLVILPVIVIRINTSSIDEMKASTHDMRGMLMKELGLESKHIMKLFLVLFDICTTFSSEEVIKTLHEKLADEELSSIHKTPWEIMEEVLQHDQTRIRYSKTESTEVITIFAEDVLEEQFELSSDNDLLCYFKFFVEFSECNVESEEDISNCFKKWFKVSFKGKLRSLINLYKRTKENEFETENENSGFVHAYEYVNPRPIPQPGVMLEKILLYTSVGISTAVFIGIMMYFFLKVLIFPP